MNLINNKWFSAISSGSQPLLFGAIPLNIQRDESEKDAFTQYELDWLYRAFNISHQTDKNTDEINRETRFYYSTKPYEPKSSHGPFYKFYISTEFNVLSKKRRKRYNNFNETVITKASDDWFLVTIQYRYYHYIQDGKNLFSLSQNYEQFIHTVRGYSHRGGRSGDSMITFKCDGFTGVKKLLSSIKIVYDFATLNLPNPWKPRSPEEAQSSASSYSTRIVPLDVLDEELTIIDLMRIPETLPDTDTELGQKPKETLLSKFKNMFTTRIKK